MIVKGKHIFVTLITIGNNFSFDRNH